MINDLEQFIERAEIVAAPRGRGFTVTPSGAFFVLPRNAPSLDQWEQEAAAVHAWQRSLPDFDLGLNEPLPEMSDAKRRKAEEILKPRANPTGPADNGVDFGPTDLDERGVIRGTLRRG